MIVARIHVWSRLLRGAVRSRAIALVLVTALGALAPGVARAEEPAPAPSVRIGWTTVAPTLDGELSPDEWAAAGKIESLTQATPNPGVAATQRTEVWLMTDEDTLYIAARMWDTNPEEIVANVMERDGGTLYDDRFGFTIDPFLDRQNGYFFQVNANGARRDALIEGQTVETSWNGRWYVEASIDSEGWTVEIALPYQSINFDPEADVWGLNIARGIRRNDEIDRWSDPVRERFLVAMGRAGYLEGMKGVKQGLGLQLTPSLTTRRVDDIDEQRHYTRFDPSLDVFYKITPSVTTSLTVNTDFGEVEVDERRVNLTRFGLFFPEKRDFFLQDALIFDFGRLEENGRPFFSRRIGLDDDGQQRDITAGGKVTGRLGPVKFGVIDVVLDEFRRSDQANLFVGRAAVSVFGESTIGGILTHGNPEADGDNTVAGLDFVYRDSDFLDNKTLEGALWAQGSLDDPDSVRPSEADPNEQSVTRTGFAFGGQISYPNDRFNWKAQFISLDSDFKPKLGFTNRVGIRRYNGEFRYRIRPDSGPWRTIDTKVEGILVSETKDSNRVESGEFTWSPVKLTTPIVDSIEFKYRHRYEYVKQDFSTIDVTTGEYHFDEGIVEISTSRNRRLSAILTAGYGSFFDGTRARGRGQIEIRPSKYVAFVTDYELIDLNFPGSTGDIDLLGQAHAQDRDDLFHVLRLRLNLQFTPLISWNTLVQYDSDSDDVGINSRLRWIIEDGREIFIVVNQGIKTRRDIRATRTEPLVKLKWSFYF